MSEKYDVIIIGGGPAGLSSAIYTARSDLETLVLDKPGNMLEKVESIENYLGFPDGILGKDILKRGKEQAKKFGAKIVEEEALIVRLEDEDYLVETADKNYLGKGLILAPGVKHEKPSIGNLEDFEGQGVSYCVTCDAPFFKDKKVGLVGSKDYAAKEALELYEFTENITILTNGKEPKIREDLKKKIDDKDIEINREKVEEIFGDEKLQGVILESGKMDFEGLFIAVGTSGSVDFARSLGVPVEGNSIVVDENLSTGLPRLYAAGDCIEEKRQISIAAGGGAKAALNLIEEMREKKYTDWQKESQ